MDIKIGKIYKLKKNWKDIDLDRTNVLMHSAIKVKVINFKSSLDFNGIAYDKDGKKIKHVFANEYWQWHEEWLEVKQTIWI